MEISIDDNCNGDYTAVCFFEKKENGVFHVLNSMTFTQEQWKLLKEAIKDEN